MTRRFRAGIPGLLLVLGALGTVAPLQGQYALQWDASREQLTREQLLELEADLEGSSKMLTDARMSLQVVRTRLEDGDFQPGDQVELTVRGEEEMSGTLRVGPDRTVDIPGAGRLELAGVLRSELQGVMQEHIATYVRDPEVRTETLIRVSVTGGVGQPGFYLVPAHIPVTDVLMEAGGPSAEAQLTELRVERGDVRVWEAEEMETAVIQGQTLDQMNIQAGDRIVVPQQAQRDGWRTARDVIAVVGGAISLVFTIDRLF